jgi:hypothetical protein
MALKIDHLTGRNAGPTCGAYIRVLWQPLNANVNARNVAISTSSVLKTKIKQ